MVQYLRKEGTIMAHGKPRDPRKEQHWRGWIHRWQRSGLSARDFCNLHHLTLPSFYAWRRTLQQREAAACAVVPVRVVPDGPPVATAGLEVVLADGRRLRVSPGFDPATLRQLLTLLEEEPPC
jgi:transposase